MALSPPAWTEMETEAWEVPEPDAAVADLRAETRRAAELISRVDEERRQIRARHVQWMRTRPPREKYSHEEVLAQQQRIRELEGDA